MNPESRREMEEILTCLLEEPENLSAEPKARLEELLRTDWECRRYYLECMDQHARLLTAPVVGSGRLASPGTKEGLRQAPAQGLRPGWRRPLAWVASIALAGLAFLAGGQWRKSQDLPAAEVAATEQTGAGCAVISQVHEAVFEVFPGSQPPEQGSMLPPGALHLKSGMVTLEFFSGATLLAEGEVKMNLHSAWEAACERGQVRVRVPPPAQGFRLLTPEMKLVDLGTEFGVKVSTAGTAEVHVFEGEVEAYPIEAEMRLLTQGQSLSHTPGLPLVTGAAEPLEFTSLEQLQTLNLAQVKARYDRWWNYTQELRRDPRLIACYLFKHWQDDRWDRLVNNFTEPKAPSRAGAAVGARWVEGRWPMKHALEFKGPGDRMRVNLGAEPYAALTLACWARVDGVDRKYNALLLTDGYEPGEPHWQIYEDGRLMFSIAYPKAGNENEGKKQNQIYYSPQVFDLGTQRRWHHLAVTYDSQTGEAVQFLDGREISREVSPYHVPGRAITFGPSEIGNWGLPTEKHQFPIRNLNGRLDEFLIYKAALSPAEILTLYENGQPD